MRNPDRTWPTPWWVQARELEAIHQTDSISSRAGVLLPLPPDRKWK